MFILCCYWFPPLRAWDAVVSTTFHRNIYTYIADVDEVITGQRREGIFAGIMTLTRKASQAGAVMLVGIVMQLSGFVSGQSAQPAAVSHTILLILSCGTLIVLALGFWFPCASN